VPAIPGYIYAVTNKDLYVNLFISNNAEVTVSGSRVKLSQKANFPWDGNVEISVDPEKSRNFTARIRIPGWVVNEAIPGSLYRFDDNINQRYSIKVNGEENAWKIENGYAVIERKWKAGDKISIDFPMPVRKVIADDRVAADREKIAIQRGPVIYCAEWPDNDKGNVLSFVVNRNAPLIASFNPDLLGGTEVIRTSGYQTKRLLDGRIDSLPEEPLTLIPYALWNNRGPGQMMVWLPAVKESSHPMPAPTIAFRSRVKASKMTRDLSAVNDQAEPANSNDHSVRYYHWWPDKDRWEWLEYDFEKPEMISKAGVYWFDDGPEGGCRIPDEWQLIYLSGNVWQPVTTTSKYTITKDGWDNISFKPVRASAEIGRAHV
jgi:hypothetical protein